MQILMFSIVSIFSDFGTKIINIYFIINDKMITNLDNIWLHIWHFMK